MGTDKLIRMMAANLWCEAEQGKDICTYAPSFDKYCASNQLQELNKNDPESMLIEEAVKNAVNHNVAVDTGAHLTQDIRNGRKRRRKADYDLKLVPKWCEDFVRICRTKFGVEVLE